MPDQNHPTKTTQHLIAASTVTGTNVYDLSGEKIGQIYDLMLNRVSGITEYAIMNFGGVFGIGEHYHPLPWHLLRYDEKRGGYVINIDTKKLQDAPAYAVSDETAWRDESYPSRVTDYYGNQIA